jgi:hypothetical protein
LEHRKKRDDPVIKKAEAPGANATTRKAKKHGQTAMEF